MERSNMSSSSVVMLLCWVLCLMFAADVGEACSCRGDHPQNSFCRSHFVINATVISKPIIVDNTFQKFQVEVSKVFKGKLKSDIVDIFTPRESSLCGAYLPFNYNYLITGTIHKGRLRIGYCNWIEEWKRLPKKIISTLLDDGFNCDCRITTCKNEDVCVEKNGEETCVTKTTCEQEGEKYCKMFSEVWNIDERKKNCWCKQEAGACVWENECAGQQPPTPPPPPPKTTTTTTTATIDEFPEP